MSKKIVCHLMFLLASLPGCGTLQSTTQSDSLIKRDLNHYRSHCRAIPRMYSGVSYGFCMLNSAPSNEFQQLILGYYLVDTVPSALLDTILLPYTGFQQVQNGNISVQGRY